MNRLDYGDRVPTSRFFEENPRMKDLFKESLPEFCKRMDMGYVSMTQGRGNLPPTIHFSSLLMSWYPNRCDDDSSEGDRNMSILMRREEVYESAEDKVYVVVLLCGFDFELIDGTAGYLHSASLLAHGRWL
jgi:hypothetical protein